MSGSFSPKSGYIPADGDHPGGPRASFYLFPRLGYTRYWYRFKGLKHNVPALASWAISLVVGFGLDVFDLMPYFYIFLPTWATSIIVYILLARMYGAAEKYPEHEEAERQFQARMAEWQASQAPAQGHRLLVKDTTALTKIIRAV